MECLPSRLLSSQANKVGEPDLHWSHGEYSRQHPHLRVLGRETRIEGSVVESGEEVQKAESHMSTLFSLISFWRLSPH